MGTYTTNLNLGKPSDADTADIAVINGNMDVLDSVIGDVDTATDGDLQTQIKTLGDSVSSYLKVNSVSVSIGRAPSSYVSVTAPSMSGYTFLCWLSVASEGWVAALYFESTINATTKVWVSYNKYTDGTGNAVCRALYVKDV